MSQLFVHRCLAPSLPLAACVLGLALGGCGPSQATVNGTVTYQNKPLTSGEIHFTAGNGPSRSALIGPLGTFEVRDAPTGEVLVAVVSYKDAGSPKGPSVGSKRRDVEPEEIVARPLAIPERYTSPKTSGLVFTISRGTQTFKIDLKD